MAPSSFPEFDTVAPTYDRYLQPHEHRRRGEDLAAEHSAVEHLRLGESTDGRPIHARSVGDGTGTALLLGGAHPNEPVGSLTCDAVAHALAADPDLRERLDCEVVIVPVADPDGAVLNRGWFDGPYDLTTYARGWYRPDGARDVEWRFPVDHGRLTYDDPPATNRVLADLIRDRAPGFLGSMHNGHLGTCYHCVSEPLPSVHETLQSVPEEYGLSLSRGEPDVPYMRRHAKGVWSVPTTVDQYEYADAETDVDPGSLDTGAGTLDFAREHNTDAVQVFTEVPYWHDPAASDATTTDRTRRSATVEGLRARREWAATLDREFDRVESLLPEGRLTAAVAAAATPDAIDDRIRRVSEDDSYDQPATRAQVWSQTVAEPYARLLYAGPFLRAVDRALQSATGPDRDRLLDAREAVETELCERLSAVRARTDLDPVPIDDLVLVQARSALTVLDHLSATGHFG